MHPGWDELYLVNNERDWLMLCCVRDAGMIPCSAPHLANEGNNIYILYVLHTQEELHTTQQEIPKLPTALEL